jgi:hypothetical protein
MNWSILSLEKSPAELLGGADRKPFSKVQTLVALLAWFVAQPADHRALYVLDYLESRD